MINIEMLEEKREQALAKAIAQGFSAIRDDLNIEDLAAALTSLNDDGIGIAADKIDFQFIFEHFCMCRLKGVASPIRMEDLLKLSMEYLRQDKAIIFVFNKVSKKIEPKIIDAKSLAVVCSQERSNYDDLVWTRFNDESAWEIGRFVIEIFLSQENNADIKTISPEFALVGHK